MSVRQSQSSATQLMTEDAILLEKVLDDPDLVATQPAGDGENEELECGTAHAPRGYRLRVPKPPGS